MSKLKKRAYFGKGASFMRVLVAEGCGFFEGLNNKFKVTNRCYILFDPTFIFLRRVLGLLGYRTLWSTYA